MVAGEVCCGFFHELELHLQFPGFPLELAQSCALTHGQRRFLAGVLTAVYANPVSEGAFVDTELLRHSGDRARCLDHHLHGFILEFRREALLRPGQLFHLSRLPILMDGLSGRLGAPQISLTAVRADCSSTMFFRPAMAATSAWVAMLLTALGRPRAASWTRAMASSLNRVSARPASWRWWVM